MASLLGAKVISQSIRTGTCKAGHTIWLVPSGKTHQWVTADADWHCGRGKHEPVSTSELHQLTPKP